MSPQYKTRCLGQNPRLGWPATRRMPPPPPPSRTLSFSLSLSFSLALSPSLTHISLTKFSRAMLSPPPSPSLSLSLCFSLALSPSPSHSSLGRCSPLASVARQVTSAVKKASHGDEDGDIGHSVCVCARERARERECVCERERVCVREREGPTALRLVPQDARPGRNIIGKEFQC